MSCVVLLPFPCLYTHTHTQVPHAHTHTHKQVTHARTHTGKTHTQLFQPFSYNTVPFINQALIYSSRDSIEGWLPDWLPGWMSE